jgi:hypothetical protein
LPGADIKKYTDLISQIEIPSNNSYIKAEYLTMLSAIDNLAKRTPDPLRQNQDSLGQKGIDSGYTKYMLRINYFFMPNKTRMMFENKFKDEIATISKPCYNWVENDYKLEIEIYLSVSDPRGFLTENYLGRLIYKLAGTHFANSLHEKNCNQKLLKNATILSLAAKSYYNDGHEFFNSLDELVPIYIENIPEDPYGNSAMNFSLTNKNIYSIGKNGVDDTKKGTNNFVASNKKINWKNMLDPSFNIKFEPSIKIIPIASSSFDSMIEKEKFLDTDNDGLTDDDEINKYKTDLKNPDTDGDGFKDGDEVNKGYNPNSTGKLK